MSAGPSTHPGADKAGSRGDELDEAEQDHDAGDSSVERGDEVEGKVRREKVSKEHGGDGLAK